MDEFSERLISLHHRYILGSLVDFFAHEINNFTTTISGNTQMAILMKKEDIYLKSLERSRDTCLKIKNFTDMIFKLSRMDLKKKEKVSICEHISLCKDLYKEHLKKRNIELEFNCNYEKLLECNPGQILLFLFTLILDSERRFLGIGESGKMIIELCDESGVLSFSDCSGVKSDFLDFNFDGEFEFKEMEMGWIALYKIAEYHGWEIRKAYEGGNRVDLVVGS